MPKEPTSKELANKCHQIFDLMRNRDWEALSKHLDVDPRNLSVVEMMGLLRWPFSARHHIPSWPKLLKNVRNELIRRNENTRSLLTGLE